MTPLGAKVYAVRMPLALLLALVAGHFAGRLLLALGVRWPS